MSELKKRILTGVVGLLFLLTIFYLGGYFLKISLLIVTSLMLIEFKKALEHIDVYLDIYILIGTSVLMFLLLSFDIDLKFAFLASILVSFLKFILSNTFNFDSLAYTSLAILYIPYFMYHLDYLEGTSLLYLVIIIPFSTDTFAYFIGSAIGKHKYVPNISPKKSLEGAVGGVLGCLFCSILYMYFAKLNISFIVIIFLGIASIFAQFGDLFASKIKRLTGIKDYGKILPGHGGFLDRFDSLIPVIPLVYSLYYFLFN